jgi:hypothetical protein
MSVLRKLFGASSPQTTPRPYVDAGVRLTHRVVQSLGLPGWETGAQGLQPIYTQDEMDAIGRSLAYFQITANNVMGGKAVFHPDATETIQRKCAAEALEELAGSGWSASADTPPQDWRWRTSTYLKAWACQLNPQVLLDLAGMLAGAGCKKEAKEALEVVLLFPSYAHRFFGGAEASELVNSIVEDAKKALIAL